jgi:N-acetylglucosamine-6-phosphate deacetylase
MNDRIIRGARLILPDIIVEGRDVLISGDTIAAVGPGAAARDAEVLDAGGAYLCPGLVDIHIHGAGGVLTHTAGTDDLVTMSIALARLGTTSFLPTVTSSPPDMTVAALSAIREIAGKTDGARILGAHMEGPYLNPVRAGAQRPDALRTYARGDLPQYIDAAGGHLRIMGLAPEMDGGMELVDDLVAAGIVPGAVHTDATYDQAVRAFDRGVRLSCHTFNAMRPVHHREPGIAVAALLARDVYSEFIADGFHLALPMIELAYRVKESGRMILVSDAVAPGVPEGDYDFFGATTRVEAGKVFFPETGVLAGSASPLMAGVKNLHANTAIPLAHIVRAASLNPATLVGRHTEVGSIAVGKRADLLLLDEKLDILEVWVGGRPIGKGAGRTSR